ncbi:hypothetical protein [Rhodoligotrophos ferricapiens]|uniref:hypothetical protein n=1 Tax=Rhodoligotrophos ferricapiens TaxID=3069264 RepID=UPI00315D4449
MAHLRYRDKSVPLPRSRLARIAIGAALVIGGTLGFLPILGFWMVPLGLLVLSFDLALVRRGRRRATVSLGRPIKRRWPHLWHRHVTEAKPHICPNAEEPCPK